MIYTHEHLGEDVRLEADLCVIGSGAGGGPVAWAAARAGLRVVVLEAGSFLQPKDMAQLEHAMFPRLYHDGAGRTTADRTVHVHQGKGVGGSTLHNINLVKRVPDAIVDEWAERAGWTGLDAVRLGALYDETERLLSVSRLREEDLSANNRVLKRGMEALGWRGGYLSHNRRGCKGSGFCELGCPFDAKENALKVFVADAVSRGAIVLSDTWALSLERDGRRVTRVIAESRHPETKARLASVRVDARAVCASCSATGTPALLIRSEAPDPRALLGSRLFLHPGAAVAGVFAERLESWRGIPQAYECTEHLDLTPQSGKNVWIIPAFAHPAGCAAILGGFGEAHARYFERYAHLAALSPMIHDHTPGRVRPEGDVGVRIEYRLGEGERADIRGGLAASARLLLAAGAERVVVPFSTPLELTRADEVGPALDDRTIADHDLDITAVHPMSGCWLGDDPERALVATADGRYLHLDNLYVADTSLFPGSTGVPPQLTTYALGLHVGRGIAAALG